MRVQSAAASFAWKILWGFRRNLLALKQK